MFAFLIFEVVDLFNEHVAVIAPVVADSTEEVVAGFFFFFLFGFDATETDEDE